MQGCRELRGPNGEVVAWLSQDRRPSSGENGRFVVPCSDPCGLEGDGGYHQEVRFVVSEQLYLLDGRMQARNATRLLEKVTWPSVHPYPGPVM